MNENVVDLPLSGVRVLDLARGSLGAAGRLLAELGADVVRVEPPGGSIDRMLGPRAAGLGLEYAAANTSKRTATLDLARVEGQTMFDSLAGRADILLESTRPGCAAAALLDIRGLHRRHPDLVIVSIPDFGEGLFNTWKASDGVAHALSGMLARSGIRGRKPVIPPGDMMIRCSADHAAFVAVAGYYNRLRNGAGDHMEVAVVDAGAQSLDPGYGIAGSASAGVPVYKIGRDRPNAAHLYPVFRCRDGFVRLCILAARQWDGLFEWMGRPDDLSDPALRTARGRHAEPALLPAIGRFLADMTCDEILRAATGHRVPVARLSTLQDVIASEQIRERKAMVEAPIAPGVSARFSNGVIVVDGVRAGLNGPPAPSEGDATAVLAEWSAPREPACVFTGGGDPARPLAGLKVLDLGIIVVGSEQGRLLADLGADVIKVENDAFPDGSRATSPALLPLTFATGNRNKRGLGLNLRHPEGRELFLKMVERCDVVLTNFKPGTCESLGIGPDVLLERNPRIVFIESSAFGNSGPWGGRMGYGPLVRATTGLTQMWRYPDDPLGFSDASTAYPDHIAARVGMAGVLALLIRRLRTGRGGKIAVSQAEVMLSHFSPRIAALSLEQAGVMVDGGPLGGAPNGVYPCAGDDEWCVISARDEGEWQSLCEALGLTALAADPDLATPAGRAAAKDVIDAAISAWTRTLPPGEVMERLQSAGVPAGKMLRVSELPDFAYYAERCYFQTLDQEHLEHPIKVDNLPFRSKVQSRPELRPAPLLGEHTVTVVRELLELDQREIERLLSEGGLEQWSPPPERFPNP